MKNFTPMLEEATLEGRKEAHMVPNPVFWNVVLTLAVVAIAVVQVLAYVGN